MKRKKNMHQLKHVECCQEFSNFINFNVLTATTLNDELMMNEFKCFL